MAATVWGMEIANSTVEDIPQYSWDSRVSATSTIGGYPILLQMWTYEHFQIGRPMVDNSPWTSPLWGPIGSSARQVFRAYPYYIAVFDQLTDNSVRWELYDDVELKFMFAGNRGREVQPTHYGAFHSPMDCHTAQQNIHVEEHTYDPTTY
ncbi:hypothetical protein E2562_038804 [Oryza meyeriana var. granulata]|uniref:Aminotransferase-like plant mobile domain-containing protein n=1 Tax=Oryza meyeriana var. granulata TaxID=110450 RepID=A0A6G1FGM3_9ORYZ|nr:hypothetical protein E2562_038804 [Oryza meyeriana var. granulata]